MFGNVDPQYLVWKYWHPREDWPGSRSFVVTRDGELIAHAAVVPGACAWASQRVTLLHLIDWVARAGSGAGVTLLKHLALTTGVLLGIGGEEETRRILPHVGFRPAGAATAYACPLYPLRVLRGGATWKLVPRLARALCRRSVPVRPDAQWQVRRLAAGDLGQITSVFPRPRRGLAVTDRTIGLFRYLLCCPTVSMRLYVVERAGLVRGYFLLAPVPGQVRIADCSMDSDEPEDWRALVLCAVDEARRDPQAAEVVSWASDPLLAGVLQSCGFHARFQEPIQMRPSVRDAIPEGILRVQMVDNDAAFLSDGRNEYWG